MVQVPRGAAGRLSRNPKSLTVVVLACRSPLPYPCQTGQGLGLDAIPPALRGFLSLKLTGGRADIRITDETGKININAAPRQLLEALPQITIQQIQNLIDYRADRDFISITEIRDLIGEQSYSAISPYITLSLSPYYTIRAEGRVTGSATRQIILAMVKIDEGLPAGYQFVSWQDQYY